MKKELILAQVENISYVMYTGNNILGDVTKYNESMLKLERWWGKQSSRIRPKHDKW